MPRVQIKKYFAEGKLAATEFSAAFVVSEKLVKKYRPFKTLILSYYKNLRTQETAQKRHARASKSYGDYNWEELLLTEGLHVHFGTWLIFEQSFFTLKTKSWKKEKLELITTHLKETRAKALRTMTVTGQHLLQEPEAVSDVDDDDDDDDDEGHDTCLGENTEWGEWELGEREWGEQEWEEREWGGWREWVWATCKVTVKADLHGTTLSHATSLQQAYDMNCFV